LFKRNHSENPRLIHDHTDAVQGDLPHNTAVAADILTRNLLSFWALRLWCLDDNPGIKIVPSRY
jgi:hypothetical protein